MKKLFLAGIAAVALHNASAIAADMPVKAPAYRAAAPYSWTGCYVGGSAGGLWGQNSFRDEPLGINGFSIEDRNRDGFLGGGQIGCDYQAPSNWLIGIQGDFSWTSSHERDSISPPPFFNETVDSKIDWFASATARLGYASGPWLIYGKGGAAWVRNKLHDVGGVLFTGFDYSGHATLSGWTLGGGFEYAFAPNWSMSLEYDYYDFGTKTVTLSGTSSAFGVTTPSTEPFSIKQNFSVVKVGLNYRFATGL
jgi:outer membrane immunogenic protein